MEWCLAWSHKGRAWSGQMELFLIEQDGIHLAILARSGGHPCPSEFGLDDGALRDDIPPGIVRIGCILNDILNRNTRGLTGTIGYRGGVRLEGPNFLDTTAGIDGPEIALTQFSLRGEASSLVFSFVSVWSASAAGPLRLRAAVEVRHTHQSGCEQLESIVMETVTLLPRIQPCMSLRRVLAAGFKHHGREHLSETELVAALALDRGWFAPEEVRQLIERGLEAGHLERDDETLSPTYDIGTITIPSGYEPPADLINPPAPFERIIDRLESLGFDKREAVADINRLQTELCLTSDTAALLYAHGEGIDITVEATQLSRKLSKPGQ